MLQLVALLIISINSHKRFYQYGGYFTYFAKIIWVQSHVQRDLSSASLQQACLLMLLESIICPYINFSKGVLFNHALYGIVARLISQSHWSHLICHNRIR